MTEEQTKIAKKALGLLLGFWAIYALMFTYLYDTFRPCSSFLTLGHWLGFVLVDASVSAIATLFLVLIALVIADKMYEGLEVVITNHKIGAYLWAGIFCSLGTASSTIIPYQFLGVFVSPPAMDCGDQFLESTGGLPYLVAFCLRKFDPAYFQNLGLLVMASIATLTIVALASYVYSVISTADLEQ